jgi:RES domain-containing protein
VRLWRISDFADLTGEGGRRAAARWNSAGRPIVYLAEHPALALLENLAHLELGPDEIPDTFQLIEVEAPDDIGVETIDAAELSTTNADWRSDLRFTRARGDDWLKVGRTALLRVPSVILPKATNVLLNPAHADAKRLRVVEVTKPAYDRRLFGGIEKR